MARNLDDLIRGSFRSDHLNGGAGADRIYGDAGDDRLVGGAGGDFLYGGDDSDRVDGDAGDDLLDGGAGSDDVRGGSGLDLAIYVAAENRGSIDRYDGGAHADTLRLAFTRAEWMDDAVQTDIADYLLYLQANADADDASIAPFFFASLGLYASRFQALETTVDGVFLDPVDDPVRLNPDDNVDGGVRSTEDDAGAAFDVLANDEVKDLVETIQFTQPENGSVELRFEPGDPVGRAVAEFVYTPDPAKWQWLAEGETATDSFTYTVTDADGDQQTETVTVVVSGRNDAPTIIIADAEGDVTEGDVVDGTARAAALGDQGTVVFHDFDLSNTHTVSVSAAVVSWSSGVPAGYVPPGGFGSLTATVVEDPRDQDDTGRIDWSYGVGDETIQGLAADETVTQVYTLTLTDSSGAAVTQDVAITITGTNDGPVIGQGAFQGDLTERADGAADENMGQIVAQGDFAFFDRDLSNTHVLTTQAISAVNSATGAATAARGAMTPVLLDGATGDADGMIGWSFAVDAVLVDDLAAGQTLTQVHRVTVTDSSGVTDSEDVTVTITGVNDAPVLAADSATTEEDRSVTIDVLANDSDVDATDVLSVTGATASHGTVTINADKTLTYTPEASYFGPDEITYIVDDENGGVVSSTVAVEVTTVPGVESPTPGTGEGSGAPPPSSGGGESSPGGVAEVVLNPGTQVTIQLRVAVPDVPQVIDVMFLQDLSGSFGDDLPNVRNQLPALYDNLNGSGRDAQFGAAYFIDRGEVAYGLTQPITDSRAAVLNGVNGWRLGYGGDTPESQFEALYHLGYGGEESWRADSQKFVVIFTDAISHEYAVNRWQARDALASKGIIPIFAVTSNVAGYYQDVVSQWGFGSVTQLTSNSNNISSAVLTGLSQSTVDLIPQILGDAYGFVTSITPTRMDNVDGPATVTFEVTLSVPDGAEYRSDSLVIALPGFDELVVNVATPLLPTEGTDGRDVLVGNAGPDHLLGLERADRLEGRLGDDRLEGGAGRDTLDGGGGTNWLNGGADGDYFLAGAQAGVQWVEDFAVGEDLVTRADEVTFVGFSQGDYDGDGVVDTRLDFSNGGQMFLLGVSGVSPDLLFG